MIILDTNVVSEFMLPRPDSRVIEWLDRQPALSLWTTSVTIFEVRFGIEAAPAGRRRTALTTAFESWLNQIVQQRILPYDEQAARAAALLAAERKRTGRTGELRDTMIAGIVLASHATLATRNIKHFDDVAKSIVNPWKV
jgi:predicted nucleic acid-binding protein